MSLEWSGLAGTLRQVKEAATLALDGAGDARSLPATCSNVLDASGGTASERQFNAAALGLLASLGYGGPPVVVPLGRGLNFIGWGEGSTFNEARTILEQCHRFAWPHRLQVEAAQWFLECTEQRAAVGDACSNNGGVLLQSSDVASLAVAELDRVLRDARDACRDRRSSSLMTSRALVHPSENNQQVVWEALTPGDILIGGHTFECWLYATHTPNASSG